MNIYVGLCLLIVIIAALFTIDRMDKSIQEMNFTIRCNNHGGKIISNTCVYEPNK